MHPQDNLAFISAAPRTLTIDGKTYPVAKLTPRMVGKLQALLMDLVPDPRDKIRKMMEGLPDAVQIEMWRGAVLDAKDWPPKFGSATGQECFMIGGGMPKLLEMVIGSALAGFTADDAEKLSERMSLEDFARLYELMNPGDPNDPKAPATAAV